MDDLSIVLEKLNRGDETAMDALLRLVYAELHTLAKGRLRGERSDITLQATALVNEAYLKLSEGEPRNWLGRAHFFAAASEAMRRILVDHARRKRSQKRGGGAERLELTNAFLASVPETDDELLAVHEALDELEENERQAAELVKLRYFVGMQHREAAEALGISKRVADRLWLIAKAWLYNRLKDSRPREPKS